MCHNEMATRKPRSLIERFPHLPDAGAMYRNLRTDGWGVQEILIYLKLRNEMYWADREMTWSPPATAEQRTLMRDYANAAEKLSTAFFNATAAIVGARQ